ncbi:Cyclin-U2-2 [Wickerhamomyces ciferrii]|uniref:Cyclin-U2-2 n=1 Tax=Wickerhamomyces ciferrii (strain ATCC 14091 / BCRC 22168 / CBS 111 / JCM 3599 / NBRC 0793 / NRRL Y-1031 F-60-10) TaxID=1206466 RepID=K0KVZ8_WICCF|nr:Cyclin-U2-2 [Wickerhamomyces ciferrii]CCH45679.1 Cyclin-U2-2 [Wickerhamomyces ciferrii]
MTEIDVSGIPIRKIETFPDGELIDHSLDNQLPSVKAKLGDVDLTQFFSQEVANLNEIDSLTAVTILNYLIKILIIRCSKEVNDDSNTSLVSNELPSPPLGPEDDTDCLLSPRKSSNHNSGDNNGNDNNNNDNTYLENTPVEVNEPQKSPNTNKLIQNKILAKRFTLKSNPPISITQYLERINHYCGLSTAVYLTSCLYLYKIVIIAEALKLNDRNVHRVLIAALRISCKTIEDINHRQTFIAKIGGVNNKDLLNLEIGLLYLLNFKCQVNEESLNGFLIEIKKLHISHSEMVL